MQKALAVIAVLAAVTACATPAAPEPTAAALAAIQTELEWAREGGASDHQIAILEEASRTGVITSDQINELFSDLLSCFDESGWTYTVLEPAEMFPGSGLYLPDYLAFPPPGMDEEAALLLYDACNDKTMMYVLGAYASQPAPMEAAMAQWDTPEVRECLEGRGYPVDPDATGSEINALVYEDAVKHDGDSSFTPCLPD